MGGLLLAMLLLLQAGGGAMQVPSRATAPLVLVPSSASSMPIASCDAGCEALADAGLRAVRSELLSATERSQRFVAAGALGRMSGGRDVLLAVLHETGDDEVALAALAGLPAPDEAALVAATRRVPLPRDVDSLDAFVFGQQVLGECGTGQWVPHALDLQDVTSAILTADPALASRVLPSLLDSPDRPLRRRAAWALRRLHVGEPACLAALADDVDPIVRLAALARACEMDDDDESLIAGARRRAAALVAEEHPLLRHLGLLTLACEDPPRVPHELVPRLRALARDATAPPSTRSLAASFVLLRSPSKEDLAIMLTECQGGIECDPGRTAIETGGPALRRWLEELASEPGPAQAMAIDMLGLVHVVPSPRDCADLLDGADPTAKGTAIRAYAVAGTKAAAARPCLEALLEDPLDWIRGDAARALLHVVPDDLALLRRASRLAAARSRLGFVTFSEETPAHVLETIATEAGPPEIRIGAWAALVKGAPTHEQAIAIVRRAMSESPADVARGVVAATALRTDISHADREAFSRRLPPE